LSGLVIVLPVAAKFLLRIKIEERAVRRAG
jgi:hypothetical protein